jgi:hypothetical protein
MFLTVLMFVVAIALSAIAAFYSIVGLAAIFAAAVVPIVIMGTVLEIAKLTVTVWLHEYWRECRLIMKLYLVPAVVVLMIITSMGIFGFLSKAHIEQAVPTGDVAARVMLLDERIANERETIANARNLLRQLDDAVIGIQSGAGREIRGADGVMRTENPAERALQVRRAQARDRAALTQTVEQAQQRIVQLQEQRAPIASQLREVEAKVGPIKYIAALVYGDDPDKNLLERAVRWVIIVLVVVFDPLAIMMLLAATESRKWYLDRRRREEPDDVAHDDAVSTVVPTDSQPKPDLDASISRVETMDDLPVPSPGSVESVSALAPGSMAVSNVRTRSRELKDPRALPDAVIVPTSVPEPEPVIEPQPDPEPEPVIEPQPEPEPEPVIEPQPDPEPEPVIEPQPEPEPVVEPQPEPEPVIEPQPEPEPVVEPQLDDDWIKPNGTFHFGPMFPLSPIKGDLFLKINTLPTKLFKFNGTKWLEIDKSSTDQYAYNDQYIEFLITEIGIGKYDPELLTDLEKEQIELRLKREI